MRRSIRAGKRVLWLARSVTRRLVIKGRMALQTWRLCGARAD